MPPQTTQGGLCGLLQPPGTTGSCSHRPAVPAWAPDPLQDSYPPRGPSGLQPEAGGEGIALPFSLCLPPACSLGLLARRLSKQRQGRGLGTSSVYAISCKSWMRWGPQEMGRSENRIAGGAVCAEISAKTPESQRQESQLLPFLATSNKQQATSNKYRP